MYTPFSYTGGYEMWKPCGQNKPYCFILINEIIQLFTNDTGVMSLSTVKLFLLHMIKMVSNDLDRKKTAKVL